jgi:hypothetical protein
MTAQMKLIKRTDTALINASWQETTEMAKVFAASGFFSDAKDYAKAVVKIIAGRELGLGPIASLRGISLIRDQIVISAGLVAALIKNSERYDYDVLKLDEKECEIAFFENGKEKGRESLSIEEAKRRKLNQVYKDNQWKDKPTWSQHPKNMLFSRCMTNGGKFYCPDIFTGSVYSPDEFDAAEQEAEIIDVDGELLAPEAVEPQQPASLRVGTNGAIATTMSDLATEGQKRGIRALALAKGIDVEGECKRVNNCSVDELHRQAAEDFAVHLRNKKAGAPGVAGRPQEVSLGRDEVVAKVKPLLKSLRDAGHERFQDESGRKFWLRDVAKQKWSIQINPEEIESSADLPDDLLAELPDILQAELDGFNNRKSASDDAVF